MRSRPHEGTGVCSTVALIGVSIVAVMPVVDDNFFATESGTTNVVDESLFFTTDGAAPNSAVSSFFTDAAFAAFTSSMRYCSVRSKGTAVRLSTFFNGASSAAAALFSAGAGVFEELRVVTKAPAINTTAAAAPITRLRACERRAVRMAFKWRWRVSWSGAIASLWPICEMAPERCESLSGVKF